MPDDKKETQELVDALLRVQRLQAKRKEPRSFHVIIKTEGTDKLIEAPVYLPSIEEARSFGELSVRVLSWYARLTAWKITETKEFANYSFDGANLNPLHIC